MPQIIRSSDARRVAILRVMFKPGEMFRVPVDGGDFAYAVMLREPPYVAFYHKDVPLNDAGEPTGSPMFVILVARPAYATGGWGRAIRRLPDTKFPEIPRFFWQDVTNKFDCKIIEPGSRRVSATPADCVGLEQQAVWSAEHIESRILDTYAGRPNKFSESLQPKL